MKNKTKIEIEKEKYNKIRKELLDGMTRDKLYKFMKTKLNEKEQEWLEKYIKAQGIMPY